MKRPVIMIGFFVLTVGGGLLIGALTPPDEWYRALAKPSFNPPPWLFAPVWTVLYVLIAIAGWRTFRAARAGPAMAAWWVQLALNFAWSPIFFGLRQAVGALVVIVMLDLAIIVFIVLVRRIDALSAWLFAPYLLWVAFATALNGAIVWLN